ncbi:MAG: zinc-binding dehydrogenase [Candidatus Marinimicrobia bacterium]|jgi:NADPH:quinone reductase-like Zn-dependent oxidoreductase|nr:zinc-binding dehydrogenase [Candidatus Neomarinimicrobiota bacterium]MBT3676422.1 zinc-binding dehydrogenase [Candidatus Neomarinimicrobiota bacterium]MBT3763768.1 zinc-binding dehydrogenase [Candidatus Neomarinimicrobiota bacterium]MBT4067111.1 zinc-binding dehydrogenase [Candidatus Neomarinimicrobiota bacterium]MBT4270049.1 zinc-binding dehydrogenase [Candidatus Neomarinimicrobiota bacterium]
MHAARIHEHGGPEVLRYESVPEPTPDSGEVVVQIKASAMNHLDLWVRRGIPGTPLPMILGSDGAGIISEIGNNINQLKVGDEVCIQPLTYCGHCRFCSRGQENYCNKLGILGENQDGTNCEFITLPEKNVRLKPTHLSFEEAAAFPLTSQTAYSMLVRRAKIETGEIIFVWGAGSGVGTMAIQIAKAKGCRIITTGGSEEKRAHAKAIGADLVLDHYKDNIPKIVKDYSDGTGVDVVFEHVGNATWETSMRILGKGGRLVTCGATTGPKVGIDLRHLFFKQQSVMGSTMGDVAAFDDCLTLVSNGKIKPIVDKLFPLSEIKQAHEHLENGQQIGKVILIP